MTLVPDSFVQFSERGHVLGHVIILDLKSKKMFSSVEVGIGLFYSVVNNL